MEASARPNLTVITNPLAWFDGEMTRENLDRLARQVQDLDGQVSEMTKTIAVHVQHERMQDRDLKAKRLRIAALETDREEKALASPERPQVELIHAVWKAACGRRRPLHFVDREQIGASVKKLGFRTCLAAVAGASYDPSYSNPMRNGKRERYDDLDLIFRTYAKVRQFGRRVPDSWAPDAEKVATLGGVKVSYVREILGEVE